MLCDKLTLQYLLLFLLLLFSGGGEGASKRNGADAVGIGNSCDTVLRPVSPRNTYQVKLLITFNYTDFLMAHYWCILSLKVNL